MPESFVGWTATRKLAKIEESKSRVVDCSRSLSSVRAMMLRQSENSEYDNKNINSFASRDRYNTKGLLTIRDSVSFS